ncbi:MAG TPA: hypothetical protein PLP23_01650 [Panacibacter sp.]|nr:hypothetical protein [Panacibacter sp.]
MNYLILFCLIVSPVFCYCQNLQNKDVEKYVDSIVNARYKQNLYELHECDSVDLIDDAPKVYKCWNYYYKDCAKKDVFKVSISFNGLPDELCFYYENNKVIKRELYKIINRQSKLTWAIYFNDDKEILYKGKDPSNEGYDKIEEAYYFSSLANEYLEKIGCR